MQREVVRGVQRILPGIAARVPVERLLSRPGDRTHRLLREVNDAYSVVLGVGNVDAIAIDRHPLRLVERGVVQAAV